MALPFDEDFTGTTTDPWSGTNWDTVPGGATIQSNKGRITTAAASYDTVTVTLDSATVGIPANFEVDGLLTFGDTSEKYFEYAFRQDEPGGGNYIAFSYRHDDGNWQVIGRTAHVDDTYQTGLNLSGTGDVRFRVQANGTAIKIKLWRASGGEPGTWDYEGTIAAHATNIYHRVALTGGSAATAEFVDIDYLHFVEPSGAAATARFWVGMARSS